jgi:hypothetical protein
MSVLVAPGDTSENRDDTSGAQLNISFPGQATAVRISLRAMRPDRWTTLREPGGAVIPLQLYVNRTGRLLGRWL